MKVFVTGVTGKSGRFFLDEIIKEGSSNNEYTFLVRNSEKAEAIKKIYPKACVFVSSFEETEAIKKELLNNKYDVLLHIAGIFYSQELVDISIEAGIKWLILVHTTGIYSKYKAAGENYRKIESSIRNKLKGKDIALTILRPTMIYGDLKDKNVSVFIKMVYRLRLFPVVSGANFDLQPVWCGDLGKAYYQVLNNSNVTQNKDYILSGGRPIQLIDMFKVIAEKLEVSNTFISVPYWLAYYGAWFIYCCSLKKIDFREKVQRLVEPRAYSHQDAHNDFGYTPLNFEDGVVDEIEQFKQSIAKVDE